MAIVTLPVSAVYDLVAARLRAGIDDAVIAPWIGSDFIETESGAVAMHSGGQFSIELNETTYPDGLRVARRKDRGADRAHTGVTVRWADALKLDHPAASYAESLRAEESVVRAVISPAANEGAGAGRVVGQRLTRRTRVGAGDTVWHLRALQVRIEHTYPLSSP